MNKEIILEVKEFSGNNFFCELLDDQGSKIVVLRLDNNQLETLDLKKYKLIEQIT